jgi:hypothetical protein
MFTNLVCAARLIEVTAWVMAQQLLNRLDVFAIRLHQSAERGRSVPTNAGALR